MIDNIIIVILIVFAPIVYSFLKEVIGALNDYDKELEDKEKKKSGNEKKYLSKAKEDSFYMLSFDMKNHNNRKQYEKFSDDYFSALQKVVKEARSYIYVLDYMAHHKPKNVFVDQAGISKISLSKQYAEYYKAIETTIHEHDLQYLRVLQLPLGTKQNQRIEEKMAEAVKLIFAEAYEHICKLDNCENFNLFILNEAIRPYSMAIIDDKYLICEYDRYGKSGEAYPDVLFIDKVGELGEESELKKFIIQQKEYIERILDLHPNENNISVKKRHKKVNLAQFKTAKENLKTKDENIAKECEKYLKKIQSKTLNKKEDGVSLFKLIMGENEYNETDYRLNEILLWCHPNDPSELSDKAKERLIELLTNKKGVKDQVVKKMETLVECYV